MPESRFTHKILDLFTVTANFVCRSDDDSAFSCEPSLLLLHNQSCLFLPHAAAHSEDLCDPDEDVDGVGVDGDGVVDRVVEGHAVGRVRVLLGAVQDLWINYPIYMPLWRLQRFNNSLQPFNRSISLRV